MSEEEKNQQVTITFGGYDDTPDNTIMFEGPLNVWKTLDDVNNLYLLDVQQFEAEKPSLIVFVRNVNKQDPNKPLRGEIPYRGSFFKYDWDKNGWQQIALGNHSHNNMEILDQIGNVNTDNLKIGDKKVLTIEKIDPDNDQNIITTDYKVAFEDQKSLPDVPVDVYGKNLYLTADKDGVKWTNEVLPSKTFKLARFVVDSSFSIDETSGHYKTIKLSTEFLSNNDILYNAELDDEILLFDEGRLVNNLKVEVSNQDEIILTLLDDNQTFDDGETILLLVIRNGIKGIVNTIENQYMTKKEAIEILSGGTIHLDQYATMKDLKDYAANVDHEHSQYVKKNEFDIFDFRYADYQHTHSQYTTREQVLGIILSCIDDAENLDADQTLNNILNEITEQLAEFRKLFVTREDVLKLIQDAKNIVTQSNNIHVNGTDKNLTKYLEYLDKKQMEIASLEDYKVTLHSVQVELGKDEEIGGYKSGDVIEKGTTLEKFLSTLLRKKVEPKLIEPELNCDYLLSNTDNGAECSFFLTPHFIQNNGGELTSLSFCYYNSDEKPENVEYFQLENNEQFSQGLKFIMNPYNEEGACITFEVQAKYDNGPIFQNNFHNGEEYFIKGNEIVFKKTIYAKRKAYFGTVAEPIPDELMTGDTIFQYVYDAEFSPLIAKYISDEELQNGLTYNFGPELNIRTIIFAIPDESKIEVKSIYFLNQNYNIMDDFKMKYIDVPNANHLYNEFTDNKYKVYYLVLAQDAQADIAFKLNFRKVKDGE